MSIQSLIFDKKKWTLTAAKKWLKARGYKTDVDEKENTWRFRQIEPNKRHEYRTIDFGRGISAVYIINNIKYDI